MATESVSNVIITSVVSSVSFKIELLVYFAYTFTLLRRIRLM